MDVHGFSPNETIEEALVSGIRCNICRKSELYRKSIPMCSHGHAIEEIDPVYVCKEYVEEGQGLLEHRAIINVLQHRDIICSQRQ